jgi:hypothetical protein
MLQSKMRRAQDLSFLDRTPISAINARARVNRFLLSQVSSQFCGGEAVRAMPKGTWRVPILLVTPGFVAGEVGEAIVNAHTREIESHTPLEQIHAAADKLRKRHHAAIKTSFLRARKG